MVTSQIKSLSAPPLRVGFIVHTFDMGGLERCVARLANQLDEDAFQPLIFCLHRNGTAAKWLTRPEVPIIELRKRPGNDWRLPRRLATAFRTAGVDIVHSHNWGTLLETTLARRLARVAVHVHAERGMEWEDCQLRRTRRWLRGRLSRWALERTDAVLAVAEAVKRDVVHRTGFEADRLRVVPNGVTQPETSIRHPRTSIRETFGIPDDVLLVGSVARLSPVKDLATAVKAMDVLRRQSTSCHLLLVGDGPEQHALRELASTLGVVDCVHFAGRQQHVGDYLAACDVYLNCSLNEGMCQSVLEAMSVGLPLVVTDVGDNALVTGGAEPCSIVVPPQQPSAIAAAIARFRDPELRHRLAVAATARFHSQYSLPLMISRYESLYRDLIASCTERQLQRSIATHA